MGLILYRVMRRRLKVTSLCRIQRHSVSIENDTTVSGISTIDHDQAATLTCPLQPYQSVGERFGTLS